MKKALYYILALAAVLCAVFACRKQDDIYKQYIKIGGYTYPAKALNLSAVSGHNRVVLQWEKPQDPAVKSAKVYWDNYTDSAGVDYLDASSNIVQLEVKDLEDRSYTFDVVNFDSSGNKSLATELTVSAYGDSWLVTHSERSLVSAKMKGNTDTAHVVLTRATDEMVATRFRYRTTDGQWTDYTEYMTPDQTEFDLPGALKGKRIEFNSGYCPSDGLDTVWNTSWVRSKDGLLYPLDTKGWTVTVTEDQVNGNFTPEKIFDGIVDQPANRWHSSTNAAIRGNFPKVLSIDTGAAPGKEPILCGYTFWEHPESASYRYARTCHFFVGDEAFNPDNDDFLTTYADCTVGRTVLSRTGSEQSGNLSNPLSGRYMALAFTDSYNANGYIDIWEFAPIGFIEGEAD